MSHPATENVYIFLEKSGSNGKLYSLNSVSKDRKVHDSKSVAYKKFILST